MKEWYEDMSKKLYSYVRFSRPEQLKGDSLRRQMCLAEDKPEKEARVSWRQYQTDHILPWIKGGETTEENAQVLCQRHNGSKGGR